MPAHQLRTGIREPTHGVTLFEAEILLDFRWEEASMRDAVSFGAIRCLTGC